MNIFGGPSFYIEANGQRTEVCISSVVFTPVNEYLQNQSKVPSSLPPKDDGTPVPAGIQVVHAKYAGNTQRILTDEERFAIARESYDRGVRETAKKYNLCETSIKNYRTKLELHEARNKRAS